MKRDDGGLWNEPPFAADEKVTVNLSPVTLGLIELLVCNGFCRSRSDMIRHAIARELDRRQRWIDAIIERERLVLGSVWYDEDRLEDLRALGERVRLRLVGRFEIASDVPAHLADQTVERAVVYGSIRAPAIVATSLGERMRAAQRRPG